MPAKKSATPSITPVLYTKLVKLGTAKGKVSSISAVLGTEDAATIQRYLDHMRTADPALWKSWGSKWQPEEDSGSDADIFGVAPATPAAEDDDEDLFGGKDYSGTTDVEIDDEGELVITDKPAKPQPKRTETVVGELSTPVIPEKFRLRKLDGTDVALEVFSRSPKFGYILRVPVPTDMRSITISGREVTLDLLALQNDPDGLTTVWDGKIVANNKLINLIKAQEDL